MIHRLVYNFLRLYTYGIILLAVLIPGAAWGAGEDSLGATNITATSNSPIENVMVMMNDTLPSGANKQCDSMAAYIGTLTALSHDSPMKGIVYNHDSTFVGVTDPVTGDWDLTSPQRVMMYFSAPKPQLVGDSIYLFGTWAESNIDVTINQRVNSVGTHERWGHSVTYGTPPDPTSAVVIDPTANLSCVLFYSNAPAGGANGRRRIELLHGWQKWKDAPQRFLWPHVQGLFAGSRGDDIQD